MKRVLVIGLTKNIGGIETYFDAYYDKINGEGFKFDFATICDKIAFEEKYKKNGSHIYKLTSFMKNPISYYRQLDKIVSRVKYDIVHINMLSAANIIPLIIAQRQHIKKIILHSHSSNLPRGKLRKILHYINLPYIRASRAIKVSCGEKAGKWLYGKKAKFLIINNAIDANKFRYNNTNRSSIRKRYDIKPNEFLLGNVGRLKEEKNQIFLIDLLKDIGANNIKLMIVGSGENKENLIKRAEQNNIIDKVILVENTPSVNKFYSAFDLFLFPSLFEGMPVAPIEAQANGLICIMPPWITKEADQGKTKFLDLDMKNWINFINKLMNDEHRDRKPALNDSYNINNQSDKLRKLYED